MNTDLRQLISQSLALAQTAPSADNSQPWVPEVDCSSDGSVVLLNLSIKPRAVFPETSDYLNRFATLSLGAFAYTFAQGMGSGGYKLRDMFAEGDFFKFYFRRTENAATEFLPDVCRSRRTDRSLWRGRPLDPLRENEIRGLFADTGTGILLESSRKRWGALYHLFAADLTRFTNPIPRKYFYKTLRFGTENDNHEGLDAGTMGIGKTEQFFLKFLRDHPRWQTPLTLLSAVPMSLIGSGLRWFYSSAMVILSQKEDNPSSWVRLGMDLQKLWLYCAKEKIGVQPIASTFLVYQYLKIPENQNIFSPLERVILKKAGNYFLKNGLLDCARPHLCLRLGYPDPRAKTPPAALRQSISPSIREIPDLK